MTRTKLLMAALTAALALSLAAGTAAALRSLSVEGAGPERTSILQGPVIFSGGGIRITCNVTFEKTISRVIPKVSGTLVGKVTRVSIDEPRRCRAEGATYLGTVILGTGAETPNLWRIFYNSILGTLPRISGVLFELRNIQAKLRVEIIGIGAECLFEGTVGVLAAVTPETGVIGRLRTLRNTLRLHEGGFGCPESGEFAATEINQAAGQRIVVSLL